MKKLEHGKGSISKLKGRRAKKYWARSAMYTDENGKKKRDSYGTYKTYNEALQALEKGVPNKLLKATLYDYFEMFTQTKKFNLLSLQTQKEYMRNIMKFEPLIFRPIHDITFYQLQEKMDDLINDGFYTNDLQHKHYKPSTLRKINASITAAYDIAIKNGVIDFNLAERIDRTTSEKADSFSSFDLDFINNLFYIVEDNKDIMRFLINCYTGLRPGEMVQLRKENISEDDYIFGVGIKTEAGRRRKIPISPKIKPFIDILLKDRSEYLLGREYTVKQYRVDFLIPLLDSLGYKKDFVAYSCRHTFADILSTSGIDKEVIKQVMGHTSYSTTSDYYISENIDHSLDEFNKKLI